MKKIVLIDGNGLCCVTWWANPSDVPARFAQAVATVTPKDATVTIAWDAPGETWRQAIYPQYKRGRPAKPQALVAALAVCHTIPGVTHVEAPGWEADDVIGTLARQAVEAGDVAILVSQDKDFAQLVGPRCLWVNGSGAVLDATAVQAKFGVPPDRIRHLLSFMGDKVDGLPGVPGYGIKRAQAKALKGEVGNELTFELTALATVPKELMRRVGA